MAALLPMTFGMAGCSTPRTTNAGIDRSITAQCPRQVFAPGDLAAQEVLTIPDGQYAGMTVVPHGNAVERENMLVRGALAYREGYRACRSVVIYVEDRDDALQG